MPSISKGALPVAALLANYRDQGAYTDCYTADINIPVSLADYVAAFYTTRLFRVERLILKWAVSRPSTDEQARLLAAGKRDTFAAWSVESRQESQLLMRDFQGRTRSWLMALPLERPGAGTRLYFGSAVVPKNSSPSERRTIGARFSVLLPIHKLYSRALLYSAAAALLRDRIDD